MSKKDKLMNGCLFSLSFGNEIGKKSGNKLSHRLVLTLICLRPERSYAIYKIYCRNCQFGQSEWHVQKKTEFRKLDTLCEISAIFLQGDKCFDFLFGSLYTRPLLKRGHSFSIGKEWFSLKADSFSQGRQYNLDRVAASLKVDAFPLITASCYQYI